jgi:hypothetical protein
MASRVGTSQPEAAVRFGNGRRLRAGQPGCRPHRDTLLCQWRAWTLAGRYAKCAGRNGQADAGSQSRNKNPVLFGARYASSVPVPELAMEDTGNAAFFPYSKLRLRDWRGAAGGDRGGENGT